MASSSVDFASLHASRFRGAAPKTKIGEAQEENMWACLMLLTVVLFAYFGIKQAVRQYKVTPKARELMRRFGFFDYKQHGASSKEKATCMRLILSHSTRDLSSIIADAAGLPGQVFSAFLIMSAILTVSVNLNVINYTSVDSTQLLYALVNWLRKVSLLSLVMVLYFPIPMDHEFWTMCTESAEKRRMTVAEIRENIQQKPVEAFIRKRFHFLYEKRK